MSAATLTTSTPRLLLDASAQRHGIRAQIVSEYHTARWGDTDVGAWVTVAHGRDAGHPKLDAEARALAGLAAAARAGHVSLCTSHEINLEVRVHPAELTKGDVWRDVRFESIESPICWSHFRSWRTGDPPMVKLWDEFVITLLGWAEQGVPSGVELIESLSPFERASLADLATLAAIVRVGGVEKRGDAFHLWTCLRAGASLFVTTDAKFRNSMRQAPEELRTPVVSPLEACECLSIVPRDLPLRHGERAWLIE